jgi:hypothetical protein
MVCCRTRKGKDGKQWYTEEDVLDLEHAMNDLEDTNDRQEKVWLFRGELVLKPFDTGEAKGVISNKGEGNLSRGTAR